MSEEERRELKRDRLGDDDGEEEEDEDEHVDEPTAVDRMLRALDLLPRQKADGEKPHGGEFLQLGLEEAFFLIAEVGCLKMLRTIPEDEEDEEETSSRVC